MAKFFSMALLVAVFASSSMVAAEVADVQENKKEEVEVIASSDVEAQELPA